MSVQPTTLVFSHHADEEHLAHASSLQFAERVRARTGGALQIQVVANNELGNLKRVMRDVLEGHIDMALPPHDRLSAVCPKFGCMSLPFVFENYEHVDRFVDADLSDWTVRDLSAAGLVALSHWDWGFRQITNSKHPILSPQDIVGLKMRVPPLSHYKLSMTLLGAHPIAVDLPLLVRVIQLGQIDGQENPISVIHALKLFQWQKYMSLVNYSYGGLTHVVNRTKFDRLPFLHQQVLREESRRAALSMRQLMRKQERSQLESLLQSGMRIDMADTRPFKAAMRQAQDRFEDEFGADNIQTFMQLVDKHSSAAQE
jgi:TRAP-type transport system periplasmic protein